MGAAFRTDWDTEPNPRYDVWTVTNGGEILPGVISPFIATMYNEVDAKGLKVLMGAYPTGKRVKIHPAPVGNFFGFTAGHLALNVGFSVAAMSCLDPDIATAMAAQFFQGSDDALRLIVSAPADEVAAAHAVATAQRDAAEAESREAQQELYEQRLSDRAITDRALPVKAAAVAVAVVQVVVRAAVKLALKVVQAVHAMVLLPHVAVVLHKAHAVIAKIVPKEVLMARHPTALTIATTVMIATTTVAMTVAPVATNCHVTLIPS